MADKETTRHVHAVEIDFAGRTYQARLTFKDLKRLEAEHGVKLLGGNAGELSDPSVVVKLLLVALQHDEPDLTLERVEEEFDLRQIGYISKKIGELTGTGDGDGAAPNVAVVASAG